jgi:hypothetical protein
MGIKSAMMTLPWQAKGLAWTTSEKERLLESTKQERES